MITLEQAVIAVMREMQSQRIDLNQVDPKDIIEAAKAFIANNRAGVR